MMKNIQKHTYFESCRNGIHYKISVSGSCLNTVEFYRCCCSLQFHESSPVIEKTFDSLELAFNGRPFSLVLDADLSRLSSFHRKILHLIRAIPPGKTATYGYIAEKAGIPGGARAVGMAMRRNPLPLVYPCHRVIRSDFSLGGFGGETKGKNLLLKTAILQNEGVVIANGKIAAECVLRQSSR